MVRKGSLSYRKRIAALLQFRLTLPGPLMLWMLLLPWRRHAGGSPKVSWRSRVTTAPSEQLISRTGMTMTMVVITMVMMMLSMMSMMRQRTTVTIHSSAVRRLLNLFFFCSHPDRVFPNWNRCALASSSCSLGIDARKVIEFLPCRSDICAITLFLPCYRPRRAPRETRLPVNVFNPIRSRSSL